MINRTIKILSVLLIGILVGVGVMVVINFTTISHTLSVDSGFNKDNPPKYRFMVIIDGTDPSYVSKINKGVTKACNDYSVVFELWSYEGEHKEENILRQFDIAIESKVDGIIIQAFNDERFNDILEKANQKQIPVITIGTDIPEKEKISFLSVNRYQLGSRVGKLLNDKLTSINSDGGTIVLLQNDQAYHFDQALALNEQLDDKYVIKPEKVSYKGENILNSEGLTRVIIDKYEDLVAIICSSGEETLGVIQGLKDTNKMNDVIIFGFDNSKEILDYIDRGIIYGTIVADNERLGYEAVENLYKYYNNEFVSMYKDISVNIITKFNVDEYLIELGEKNDQ